MTKKVKVWGGFGEKKSNNNTQWYIQDRIYDPNGLCPALTDFKADYWIVLSPKDDKMTCENCKNRIGKEECYIYGTPTMGISPCKDYTPKESENKMIRIIERTDKDIENETKELFEKCKPYLDQGYGFYKACRIVRNIPETSCFGNQAWYKRFKEYAKTQGYTPLR